MKLKGYILGGLSSVSYGLIPLFILPLKGTQFPLTITLFYRFLFSALFLGSYLLIKKESIKISLKEFIILFLLGGCYALSTEFLINGYDLLTPGIASTVLFIYPVIVALLMFFFFKEKLTKLSLSSLLFAFVGVIILCLKGNQFDINYEGLGIVTLSALFYAIYMVVVNKAKLQVSGFKLTFFAMSFTACIFGVKSLALGESFEVPNVGVFFNLMLFALLTTVVSSVCLVFAIKNIGSTAVAILGALEPVVAVLISVLLFQEKFTFNLLVGISLILFGVVLNIIASNKKA